LALSILIVYNPLPAVIIWVSCSRILRLGSLDAAAVVVDDGMLAKIVVSCCTHVVLCNFSVVGADSSWSEELAGNAILSSVIAGAYRKANELQLLNYHLPHLNCCTQPMASCSNKISITSHNPIRISLLPL